MLNIPDTVKALFKRDGVRKNFRVHFPNGELPDITNENIVEESVKFTESLCSQDVLKFGLTESSVINFETVGIGNMYGMTIECGLEIDLSSLSAADIAAIAAGTWDGVYTAVGDSDLGYAYFRVPYGTFRIKSCPRDHQAMTHRKVQAFTLSFADLYSNPFEDFKLINFYAGNNYRPNIYLLILSLIGYKEPSYIQTEGFTEGASLSTQSSSDSYNFSFTKIGGGTGSVTISVSSYQGYNRSISSSIKTLNMDNLYALHFNYLTEENINTMFSDLATALEGLGTIDLAASGYSSWLDMAKACLTDNGHYCFLPWFEYHTYYQVSDNTYNTRTYKYLFEEENLAIYPLSDPSNFGEGRKPNYGGYGNQECTYGFFMLPYNISIRQGSSSPFYTNNYVSQRPDVKIYERVDPVPSIKMTFNSTLQTTFGMSTLYSFANCYSKLDLLNGWLEVHAQFGKANRVGSGTIVSLSNSSPVSIIPGEYMELWWDEYDVDEIGTVKFTYFNENNEECIVIYTFGTGSSVYDINDNVILKNMLGSSESSIKNILDTYFIPNLSPILFTPIELQMKGLPYLESGDYLEVTAEDGTVVNSFNMNNDLSGIQVLTADITSTSGQIIESEAQ